MGNASPPVHGETRVGIRVEAIHHVGLVVRDLRAAEAFYLGVLGLERHHRVPSWLVLNERAALHLVHLPGTDVDLSPRRVIQHVALQVPDLREILALLLDHGIEPFQMGFDWSYKLVTSPDDPLDFGIGTLFARDPDRNLIEFVQLGSGIFDHGMRPRASRE